MQLDFSRRALQSRSLAAFALVSSTVLAGAALAGDPLIDAEGDAVDLMECGGPLTDLAAIDIRFDEDTVYIDMAFHTPITAPSALEPTGLGGIIEFDIDQDPETGRPAVQNQWSPPFAEVALGAEYALLLAIEHAHPGFVELRGLDESLVMVPVTYSSHGMSVQFPIASFSDGDGTFDFSSMVGNPCSATDAGDSTGTSYRVCSADLDANGMVDVGDLLAVLAGWGTDAGDVTGDGMTDVADLLGVLAAWGACD